MTQAGVTWMRSGCPALQVSREAELGVSSSVSVGRKTESKVSARSILVDDPIPYAGPYGGPPSITFTLMLIPFKQLRDALMQNRRMVTV